MMKVFYGLQRHRRLGSKPIQDESYSFFMYHEGLQLLGFLLLKEKFLTELAECSYKLCEQCRNRYLYEVTFRQVVQAVRYTVSL